MMGLLFMDVNNLKRVNDCYGHKAGDLLLKEFAGRLMEATREKGIASRIGGDEFTVILDPIRNFGEAAQAASRIYDLLSSPYDLDGVHIDFVSASIGMSVFPIHSHTGSRMVTQSDTAMYHAKERFKARLLDRPILYYNKNMRMKDDGKSLHCHE
jgi:diguanylate cyclase (GGDEF)-like protein